LLVCPSTLRKRVLPPYCLACVRCNGGVKHRISTMETSSGLNTGQRQHWPVHHPYLHPLSKYLEHGSSLASSTTSNESNKSQARSTEHRRRSQQQQQHRHNSGLQVCFSCFAPLNPDTRLRPSAPSRSPALHHLAAFSHWSWPVIYCNSWWHPAIPQNLRLSATKTARFLLVVSLTE